VTCDQKGNPKSVAEALSGEDKEKWKIVMQEDYKGLLENRAWVLIDLTQGQKIVKNK
jgi:hypothetical protein